MTDAGRERPRLPADIGREIDQVAHFGRAPAVKKAVLDAAAAYEAGSYDDAITLLIEAKRIAPRSVVVRELLGLSFYALERWREAARELAAYRRMSGERDQDPTLADVERALGRPEKALEILEGLEGEDVSEEVLVEGLIVRAAAFVETGRAGDAVAMLRSGPIAPSRVLPHHLRLWYSLADALEEAGDRREARQWWDAIYAEDPDFFDVSSRRLGLKRRRR